MMSKAFKQQSLKLIQRYYPFTTSVGNISVSNQNIINQEQSQQQKVNTSPQLKSVYKRPLSSKLIPFASEKGKKIFKRSLEEGNMESYFKLAEQFVTQIEPQTCGTTSLSMVLNALEIDPKRQWKGMWRWNSEQNLSCLVPEYYTFGISLQNFANLALCNQLSVLTFFHEDSKKLRQYIEQPPIIHQHEVQCDNQYIPQIKYSSYNTFKSCVLATSRRDGFYLVLNSSRKALEQTGSGHYSPLAGYCQELDQALVLDVARFKYPSYWCDTQLLYQSFQDIDKSSKLTRGYILVSKELSKYSEICRVTQDITSINGLKTDFYDQLFINRMHKLSQSNQLNQETWFKQFFSELNSDFKALLVYYLYHFELRLSLENCESNNFMCGNHLNVINKITKNTKLWLTIHSLRKQQQIFYNGILDIIQDFIEEQYIDTLLCFIFMCIPKHIILKTTQQFNCIEIVEDIKSFSDIVVNQKLINIFNEIKFVSYVFGWNLDVQIH